MDTSTNCTAQLDPAKHVNYAYGMVLGVDDFTQQFAYLSGRDQWLARDILGYGTVNGLKVSVDSENGTGPRVHVTPGTAVNQQGQMIHIKRDQCAGLNKWLADETNRKELENRIAGSPPKSQVSLYVVLGYRECLTDDRPIPGEPCRDEKDLMAPSRVTDDYRLELSFDKPRQCEETAIRAFIKGLGTYVSISDAPGCITDLDHVQEFAEWVRDSAFIETSPPCSPPGFGFGSPPSLLHLHPDVASAYLRAAFRVWVTELRPKFRPNFMTDWCGCTGDAGTEQGTEPEERVLLAELQVPVDNGQVKGSVTVNEENRPYLVSLRMLQEWLLNGQTGMTEHGALRGLYNDDHPQYHDDARGDARYSPLSHSHLLEDLTDVATPAPTDGQVLTRQGSLWIAEDPVVGATDHGALSGLGNDDHPQYLRSDGARPLEGNLNANNHQVTGLAPAANSGDAVPYQQAIKIGDDAGSDLDGKYPNPTVIRLHGRYVSNNAPNNDDVLTWNGAAWEPKMVPTITDHGALSGLGDDDHPQYHDDARGDARYSVLTHSHLLDDLSDVTTPAPTDGQVLTRQGGQWIAEDPVVGVTDHGALSGLGNDDHPQYLRSDGARPLEGNLNANNHQVTGLAPAANSGDAVPYQQAIKIGDDAGSDLDGKYPNPTVIRLHGRYVSNNAPNNDDVLTWNGAAWEPKVVPTITDHGALSGLSNDDHLQYLRSDGARPLEGNLNANNHQVTGLAPAANNGDAVPYQQAVKVDDAAGGDLGGTYPAPTVTGLHGRVVSTNAPNNDEVLTWNGAAWEPKVVPTVTAHGALSGLGNDDHPQYLRSDGARPLEGNLNANSHQVTGLAPAANNGDAVPYQQAVKINDTAGGDLGGTYPAPTVTGLHGRVVSNNAPNNDEVLTWNGAAWEPKGIPIPAQTGNFVMAMAVNPPFPYAIVGAGWFDGSGNPVLGGPTYNRLRAKPIAGSDGDYLLRFDKYDYNLVQNKTLVYIVKGTVWEIETMNQRATFELVRIDATGITVRIRPIDEKPDMNRLGFMVEISAYGKL